MRKSLLVIFLCLLILPVYGGNSCVALEKDWDRILDKYESLCESCFQLKQKAEAGEKVSKTAFGKLFSSLSELRTELREGSGSMTEQQRSRFESIRAKYSAVFGGTAAVTVERESPEVAAPVSKPKAKIVHKDQSVVVPEPPERVISRLEALPRLSVPKSSVAALSSVSLAISPDSCVKVEEATSVPRRVYGSAAFVVAVWPVLSYGASFSLFDKNTGWGGYLKFHSNFKSSAHSYLCSSDGSWDGGTMWTNGNSQVSYMQTSAGMRKNLGRWLGICAGAGYGRKVVLWEDVAGEWAKVEDLSPAGVLFECGLVLDVGPVEIQTSVSTIAFRTASLEVGLGFRF